MVGSLALPAMELSTYLPLEKNVPRRRREKTHPVKRRRWYRARKPENQKIKKREKIVNRKRSQKSENKK